MVLSLGYDKAYCWNCSILGTHTFIFFEEKNGEKHSVFLHLLIFNLFDNVLFKRL